MVRILWVDDEVELLKPHVLFLRSKGYEVDTCNNGYDAIDMAAEGRGAGRCSAIRRNGPHSTVSNLTFRTILDTPCKNTLPCNTASCGPPSRFSPP